MVPVMVLGVLLWVQLSVGQPWSTPEPQAELSTTQGSHELRLVGGGGRCAGRVEVKHEGEWGSVCSYDFDWDAHWATVVCRQLGCGTAATSSPYAPFGQGTGRIWLHIFFCRGQEETLQDCPHFGWGQHYCGHEQDVGVTCTGEPGNRELVMAQAALIPDPLPIGFSRLVGGDGSCSGLLQVRQGRAWTSVCEDGVDLNAARVVCRELGCGSVLAVAGPGLFPMGSEPQWDTGFECTGTELLLSACKRRARSTQGCSGPGGAGPAGSSPGASRPCPAGSRRLRLAGGPGRCAGRVELYVNGAWSPVCQDGWDIPDATVVCRQLRCGAALEASGSDRFGPGAAPPWTGAGGCTGSEASLWDCPAPLETGLHRGAGVPAGAQSPRWVHVCPYWDSSAPWPHCSTG
uniref:Uncharacterized protein n=1 Tax=Melopsittacus undulatus TaxID=13146 RepID=A0A8V5FVI4_MELUD